MGECLRSDVPGSFRSAALLFTGPHLWASWGGLLHTVQTGETAALHVHGEAPFAYFETHPEEGRVFDEAMAAFTSMVALGVAAAYDFAGITTLVDVGGGNGALLIGILRAHAQLRGVVFDLPRVGAAARRQIDAAGLASRCQVVSGDFFAEVPSGGDAYMLKHVIHDWNDERATVILRNCHRAMGPNGKLLIVEGVYPPRIDRSIVGVGAARNDVNMMVVTGGRQRSEAEFRELYRAAGFELTRIVPTMGPTSVIEGKRR
jgi:SAM-dependent methyltransferase